MPGYITGYIAEDEHEQYSAKASPAELSLSPF
jgi:hypothetical protein